MPDAGYQIPDIERFKNGMKGLIRKRIKKELI
jgi:hypothetical protein